MMGHDSTKPDMNLVDSPSAPPVKMLLISAGILIVSVMVAMVVFLTEPKAKREGASKITAMLVDTVVVSRGEYSPRIVSTGTVVPEEDVSLSAQVSGQVVWRSADFTPGSVVRKGQTLMRIDPADYQNQLEMRQGELQQAEADLQIEMGRQKIAQADFDLAAGSISAENQDLLLRAPQLKTAQSKVAMAQAAVRQAELQLARTSVRAPFDAVVVSRDVSKGTSVSTGETLGRLIGQKRYWVETTVPVSMSRWIAVPTGQQKGAEVLLRNRTAWEPDTFRKGYILRMIGELEPKTRMVRLLVAVDDPLAQKNNQDASIPPLLAGEFLEVQITGKPLDNVVRLPRKYIRKNNTVWVMHEDKLQIRTPEILMQDAAHAYVLSGLEDGDAIVTTNLSTVVEGAPLRTNPGES